MICPMCTLFDAINSDDVYFGRHDPHGGAYVLIGYSSGSVLLWDAADHCSMTTFERCAVGLTGIRWMAWASGNFLALR